MLVPLEPLCYALFMEAVLAGQHSAAKFLQAYRTSDVLIDVHFLYGIWVLG